MPRSSQIHRDRPLENVSIAFTPQGFIADQLSPRAMVEHESDTYYTYERDFASAVPETLRADGAESNRATFNLSIASYVLQEHALHEDITDRQRGNADKPLKLDVDVTEDLTARIMLRREVDVQTLVQTAANWTNQLSLSAAVQWSVNTTVSNPIVFVDTASSVILVASQRRPNVMAINDQTFNAIKEHTSIVDRIKYTSPESVGKNLVARLFNVEQLLVAEAVRNTAAEAVPVATTMTRVWTDSAFLGYVGQPGLKRVSALFTFWKNNTGYPQMVKKWREEKIAADRIEVSAMFDNKIVASACGYLFIDTNG